MNFAALLKPPYIAGGLGAVGVSAAGIAGGVHYFGDKPHWTGDERMGRWGYTKDHGQFRPNHSTKIGEFVQPLHNDRFHLKTGDCFGKFFPGAQDPGMPTSSSAGGTQLTLVPPPKTPSKPAGCTSMNLSVTTDTKAFLFKSEIVVKTANFGMSLSVGSSNLNPSQIVSSRSSVHADNIFTDFRMLFLEKRGNSWSVAGGYYWAGASLSTQFTIYGPNKTDKWLQLPLTAGSFIGPSHVVNLDQYSDDGKWQHKTYVGIWSVNSPGHEIFDDVMDGIWRFSGGKYEYLGINSSTAVYSEGVWRSTPGTMVDLSDMYIPFKDKKGTWVSTESYCNTLSAKTNLPQWEMEKLRDICYRKQ